MQTNTSTTVPVRGGMGPRSCTTCAKAKAKCVKAPGQMACERCTRLEKECCLKEPVARKRKVVKTTRAAQLENLEHKIEHLVKALSSKQAGTHHDSGQLSPPVSQDDPTPHRTLEVVHALIGCSHGGESGVDHDSLCGHDHSNTAITKVPRRDPDDFSAVGVSKEEAQMLLDRFRVFMAPSNPFVQLPLDATAQHLYDTKPLLLHAIVTVASFHDHAVQLASLERFMQHLSKLVLVNGEKNLGNVQGMLVLLNWYHPYIFSRPQATLLLYLASAQCVELGIDRARSQCGEGLKAHNKLDKHGLQVATLHDYRALTGVYYLTSMFSSCFRKVEAISWTPYVDQCLSELEEAGELESDQLLVQLVRTQHLIAQTTAVQVRAGTAPTHFHINAFVADLNNLKHRGTYEDRDNVLLQMQYLVAEIHIYGLSLTEVMENERNPLSTNLNNLFMLIAKIKDLLATFYRNPVQAYLTMPFAIFAQYAHSFIIYTKLASLEIEGWNTQHLQDEMRFAAEIDRSVSYFDAAVNRGPEGIVVRNDVFSKWSHRLRWMKNVYESKFQSQSSRDVDVIGAMMTPDSSRMATMSHTGSIGEHEITTTTAQQPQQQQPQWSTPPDDMFTAELFSYLDDSFWQGFPMDVDLSFNDTPIQLHSSTMVMGQSSG